MKPLIINTPKGKRIIGTGYPTFIVAEMSGNHNQDIKRAYKIIDEAAKAGVDAIKLQTYTPDTMTIDCKNNFFQIKSNKAWKGQTLYELYKKAYTPWEWQEKFKKYGEKKGLVVFSTPFDDTSVNFLEKLKVVIYKVASFEITDHELLKKIAKTKKPVIISRGMSSLKEIRDAIRILKANGTSQLAVLHCVSAYPAATSDMNLATIADIQKRFKVVSGLSDHTLGITAASTSIALGASIIEKHFTLKRSDGGPDAGFSLEPAEMKALVLAVREAEAALGKVSYRVGASESENRAFRRSLFVVSDIKKGEKITRKNVRCIRPGYGLEPKYFSKVVGLRAKFNIVRGTPLQWKMLAREIKA